MMTREDKEWNENRTRSKKSEKKPFQSVYPKAGFFFFFLMMLTAFLCII